MEIMNHMEATSILSKNSPGFRRKGGFTLLETVFAACILAVFVCTSFIALTQINRYAANGRLKTLALAFAQQKLDLIMTVPWSVSGTRPTILAAGTVTENNLPLDNDNFNHQTGLSSVFSTLDLQVSATRTTVITNVTARILRATVTLTYTYRSITSTITLTSLRTTDNI
jgi:type II secretory pathway pseudopilin PulG